MGHEAMLAEMLNNFGNKGRGENRNNSLIAESNTDHDLEQAKKEAEAENKSKDDSEVSMKNKDFA